MEKPHSDVRAAALTIFELIAEDIDAGLFEPGSVLDSWAALHEQVDANEYVDQVVQMMFGEEAFNDHDLLDEIITLTHHGLVLAPLIA